MLLDILGVHHKVVERAIAIVRHCVGTAGSVMGSGNAKCPTLRNSSSTIETRRIQPISPRFSIKPYNYLSLPCINIPKNPYHSI